MNAPPALVREVDELDHLDATDRNEVIGQRISKGRDSITHHVRTSSCQQAVLRRCMYIHVQCTLDFLSPDYASGGSTSHSGQQQLVPTSPLSETRPSFPFSVLSVLSVSSSSNVARSASPRSPSCAWPASAKPTCEWTILALAPANDQSSATVPRGCIVQGPTRLFMKFNQRFPHPSSPFTYHPPPHNARKCAFVHHPPFSPATDPFG